MYKQNLDLDKSYTACEVIYLFVFSNCVFCMLSRILLSFVIKKVLDMKISGKVDHNILYNYRPITLVIEMTSVQLVPIKC